MKSKKVLFTIIFIIAGIAFYPRFSNVKTKSEITFDRQTFTIQKTSGENLSLSLEIADTDERRQQGLMNRTEIEGGMLFIFNPPRLVTMWMKNTPSSLDMLFLDEQNKIHRIVTNTRPFSTDIISSGQKTKFVIELPANDVHKLGIHIGDRLNFPQK